LSAAARRIGGDRNASPVWNPQTNFGGGKTHAVLALYHLLSGTPLTEYPEPTPGHDHGQGALGHVRRRFGAKGILTERFNQLTGLRNCIRHSRTIDEVTRKLGEAAILWFRQILDK
jgi:hypothetical protein